MPVLRCSNGKWRIGTGPCIYESEASANRAYRGYLAAQQGDDAMMVFDKVGVTSPRRTKDGYLVAEAHVARTGIQLYTAGELGIDGDPTRIVRVYRPPDEVFAPDAMASYAHRPVTVDHPNDMVTADNWKQLARGQTGDEVMRDGEFVRVPLLLMDQHAIDEWEAGKREMSMGYKMQLEIGDGETPDGQKYDAVQRNLRMNHLALVTRARGGSELRLGDKQSEDNIMPDVNLTTITVDGLAVETTDAGAQAISKLNTELADARTALDDANIKHQEVLAAKDGELAAKDAEIDELKGKQLSDEELDQRIRDRADLIATAKSIADMDYSGKNVEEIRALAVAAKLGQDTITDKSAEYIAARFDILAEDANQDPVRKVLRNGDVRNNSNDSVEQAHANMVNDLQNAWKGNDKEVQ